MSHLPALFRSLRVQLALVGLVVQLLVAGAMVWALFSVTDRGLANELSLRVAHSAPLLKASLIEPLIQRDYATAEQILKETRAPDDFKYFVLLDRQNRVIASVGRPADAALSPIDNSFAAIPWDRPDACMHLSLDIAHAGQPLGQLRYAVSLQPFIDQRQQLLEYSLWVAALGTLLGTSALALGGLRLTRGLHQLSAASAADSVSPAPAKDASKRSYLALQITLVEPSVSTAASRRTMAPRLAMRCIPTASAIVIATGRPSGTIETIWLIATMKISTKGSPRSSPNATMTPKSTTEAATSHCPN